MGKPYPMQLRIRVFDHVEEGNSHRATAAHFRVPIKSVNDMVKLKRDTGKLAAKPGTTLDELRVALQREKGIVVCRSSVGDFLKRLGLSHKKRSSGQRAKTA